MDGPIVTHDRYRIARVFMQEDVAAWLATGGFNREPEDCFFQVAVRAYRQVFGFGGDVETFDRVFAIAGEVVRTAVTPPPVPTVRRLTGDYTLARVNTGPGTFNDYRVDCGGRAWVVCGLVNPNAATGAAPMWVTAGVSFTLPAAKARVAALCAGRIAGYMNVLTGTLVEIEP
jgi:hypothetical protein